MHSRPVTGLSVPAFPIDPRRAALPSQLSLFSIELFFVPRPPQPSPAHVHFHSNTTWWFRFLLQQFPVCLLLRLDHFCTFQQLPWIAFALPIPYPGFPQIHNSPNPPPHRLSLLPQAKSHQIIDTMATTAMDYENANGDRFDGMSPSSTTASSPSLPLPAFCVSISVPAPAPAPAPAPDALRMDAAWDVLCSRLQPQPAFT